MPYALSIGMTKQEFMKSKPIELVAYGKADRLKQKRKDEELWLQGFYNYQALQVAFAHFGAGLFGKKSDAKYMDKPITQHKDPYEGLTQEEIDNIEIQKMIAQEDLYIAQQKMSGMAEVNIK